MKLIAHLVRFDLRALARPLWIWGAVLAVQSAVIWTGPPIPAETPDLVRVDLAATVMRYAVIVVLVALLVHRDAPGGTAAFWLTRPIPRWTLLAAKSVVAFLLVVLVPFVWFWATVFFAGFSPAASADAALAMATEHIFVAAVSFVLAVVSTNLAQVVVAGLVTMVTFAIGREVIRTVPRQPLPFALSLQAGESVSLVLPAVLAALLFGVVAHQYMTLKSKRSIALCAGVVLLAIAMTRFPPWRVVEAAAGGDPRLNAAAPSLWIDPSSMREEVFFRGGPDGTLTGTLHSAIVHEQPSPGGIVLKPVRVATTVRFRDGLTVSYTPDLPVILRDPAPDDVEPGKVPAALAAALGDVSMAGDSNESAARQYRLRLLEVRHEVYAVHAREPAVLDVSIENVAYKYRAVARLPLRSGASVAYGNGRCRIEGLDAIEDGLAVAIREDARPVWAAVAPTSYVLYNPGTRQALVARIAMATEQSTTIFAFGGVMAWRRDLNVTLNDPAARRAFMIPAWLDAAELLVLQPETIGRVSRSAHLDGFVLDTAFAAAERNVGRGGPR